MSRSMRVTIEFPSYNARRYGRPWIALVTDWPIGKPPVLEFGGLIGRTVEILASPGQVVRWGQRDNRGNHGKNCWGIVRADGSIAEYGDPEFCRRHWLAGCPLLIEPGADNVVSLRGTP